MKRIIALPLISLMIISGLLLNGCCKNCPMRTEQFSIEKLPETPIDVSTLKKLDPASGTLDKEKKIIWYDAKNLTIEGKAYDDTETFYERLPKRAKPSVSASVSHLCTNTAGIAIHFISDGKKFQADWTTGGCAMNHMAFTGIRGLDLYAKRDGKWVSSGSAKPKTDTKGDNHTIGTIGDYYPEMPQTPTEYMLYLPLYDKVLDLKIGVPEGSFIAPAPALTTENNKPILYYGTSITQGGCASRSGMAHPEIVGRWMNKEVFNFGFSASGCMELEMAKLFAELDPCIYVLECLPNMSADMVKDRVEPFVEEIRKAHPKTPIMLVESSMTFEYINKSNEELKLAYERLQAKKVPNVFYMPYDDMLTGIEDGTVDGVHPTDLGFERIAMKQFKYIKKILSDQKD